MNANRPLVDDADVLDRLAAYRQVLDDATIADATERSAGGRDGRQRRRGALLAAAAGLVGLGVAGLVVVDGRDAGAPPLDERPADVESDITSVDTSDVTPDVTAEVAPDEQDVDRARPTDVAVDGLPLQLGSTGEDVGVVQRRLASLGFVPGAADGVFDITTRAAVWAFEKAVLGTPAGAVTGVVDDDLWTRLHGEVEITGRAPAETGRHVEVWLPEQLVVVVDDGDVTVVSHASTGDGAEWCGTVTISPGQWGNEQGTVPVTAARCGRSITPGGVFEVRRRVDGVVDTDAGRVVDPLFFNHWIGLAGADDVPPERASRGHVSVPVPAIGEIRRQVDVGTPVWVFDGEHAPEEHGEQLPVFTWADPDEDGVVAGDDGPVDGRLEHLALGDSVMLGAASQLARAGVTVDAMESRQLVDVVPVVRELRDRELLGSTVVVHLGTQGTFSQDSLDELMDALADVPNVVVMTVRADRSWTAGNNVLLRELAGRPNVILLDWELLAAQCPGDCFAADGIHLRADGQRYYAQLVLDLLGLG